MVACVSWNGEYVVAPPQLSVAEEGGRRDYHGEANPDDAEVHPVDAELARRLRHLSLDRRIRAAQRRLLDALGDRPALYLEVERLVAHRARERRRRVGARTSWRRGWHSSPSPPSSPPTRSPRCCRRRWRSSAADRR